MNVNGGNGVGQEADGDIVHSGFGKLTDGVERDTARGFERHTSSNELDSLPGLLRIEIVQKHNVRARLDHGFNFADASDLDLNLYQMSQKAARFPNCMSRTMMEHDVVVLNQNTIEKSHAMIHAATA